MTEHTPGPWDACHNGECICKLIMAQDHPVAKVFAGDWGDEPGFPYGHIPEERARANARVISLAPEMLEFIEEVAKGPYPDSDVGSLMETLVARAAHLSDKAKAA